ncbi:Alpha/Beta hydrolase protein [Crassisporium funariophilum]|nr:Alpha/Beta hydrolase protein [Crassisporium funariophilum]
MSTPPAPCVTLSYKRLPNDKDVLLDFYPPMTSGDPPIKKVPAVVFFITGNRRFFFPTWLQKRVNSLGYAFISADHQLLPGTGHDMLNDVRDLFKYIAENHFTYRKTTFEIDPEKIVVAGGCSGGFLAQLAAVHITSPKPKGVLALYAMGGDFFVSDNDLTSLVDPNHLKTFLPPFPEGFPAPTSDVPPTFDPTTGFVTEPRMALTSLSLQLGIWLDYYTGEFKPSLSKTLRDALDARVPYLTIRDLIPERHRSLFPTFLVNASWPPTLLVHGTADTAVPILSSRRMNILLKNAGVDVQLIEVEGKEHLFDIEQNADVEFAGVFDKVEEFLKTCMQK